MRVAAKLTGPDTNPGWPWAVGPMIWRAKPWVNMNGWYCKAASSSHSPASPNWI
jgi:hypothetical protein